MIRFMLAVVCAATSLSLEATAQTKPEASPRPGTESIQLTSADLALLIKSAVVALHQANVTGNYSVLRDLGTPIFREKFDQAQLTAIFANLRQRNINLGPAMLLNPTLAKQPDLTEQGTLTMVGTFPTQPLQIQFQIVYQRVGTAWRIDGMAVDAVQTTAMAAPQVGGPGASSPEAAKAAQATDQGPAKPAPLAEKSKPKKVKKEPQPN